MKMRIPKRIIQVACVLAAICGFLISEQAFACPVCYGASDSPMTAGVNFAILTLLGITGSVLAGFVSFFLYMRRRAKRTLNGSVDFPSEN